jgi:phage terminase large subunit-like protein
MSKPTKKELQAQIEAAKRLLQAKAAQDSLIEFTKYTMPDPNNPGQSLYTVKPAHIMIAQALEQVAQGKLLRLLISMPPQHGKSELTSRRFPAWFVGKMPFKNVMFGTYNQPFADEFGDDVRNIILSPEFSHVFPHCTLRPGSKAKDHMVTTQNGKMSFLGRGGSGTGRPADLFIIDDPIKDAKEADSITIRDDVWEWFTKVAYTRCHTLTPIVIIMTRWSEDDLIGRLTDPKNPHYSAEEAAKWTYLNIPVIFESEELAKALGGKVGEPLWPERFSKEHLESARRMNPYGFEALYMGRPTPPEGAFFKQSHIHGYGSLSELPKNLTYYGSCDLAVSPERNADKSCIGNWGVDENGELWLLPDLYWERKAADESTDQLLKYGEDYKWITLFAEKGVIDRAIRPFMNRLMMEQRNFFHVETFPASGSKAHRCQAIRGMMARGEVHFPVFAPWWPAAKEQMLKFTGSGNDPEDDFCDMLGLMGMAMDLHIKARPTVERKGNVLKVGTMAWIKQQSRYEEQQRQRIASLRGF